MATRPPDLPDYERPPVDEVVLGVQYLPIPGFSQAHAGLYWRTVQSAYPKIEDHPRIDAAIERLSGPAPAAPAIPGLPLGLQIQFGGAPNSIRSWLISDDETWVLQIQNDCFLHNWRKKEGEYPHFDRVQERFTKSLAGFADFLRAEGLPAPQIQQFEVSYINWVPQDVPIHQFFRPASATKLSRSQLTRHPEQQAWIGSYIVSDSDRVPIARLSIQVVGAIRADPVSGAKQGTQFTLTFRAPMADATAKLSVAEIQQIGRKAIVQSFTDLTSGKSQTQWGRIQ